MLISIRRFTKSFAASNYRQLVHRHVETCEQEQCVSFAAVKLATSWEKTTPPSSNACVLLVCRFLIDDSLYELHKGKASKESAKTACPSCESQQPFFSRGAGQMTQNGNSISDCLKYD